MAGWFDPVTIFWPVATLTGCGFGALVGAVAGLAGWALVGLLVAGDGAHFARALRVVLPAMSTLAAAAWAWVLIGDAFVPAFVVVAGIVVAACLAAVMAVGSLGWVLEGRPSVK